MKNKEEKNKIFWKATGIILIVAVLLSIPITICCVLTSRQKAGKKSVESWCREYAIAEVFKDTENYNYGITSEQIKDYVMDDGEELPKNWSFEAWRIDIYDFGENANEEEDFVKYEVICCVFYYQSAFDNFFGARLISEPYDLDLVVFKIIGGEEVCL